MSTSEKTILAVLAVFAILVWLMPLAAGLYWENQERKKRGEPDDGKAQYDERQKLIRLQASGHALYALSAYLLVWLVLEFVGVLRWENRTLTLLAAGLLLAMVVWSGECILRGAMLGYNQGKSEGGQILSYLILGVCWISIGLLNLDGALHGSLAVMQLLLGASWLIMGMLMLYARRRRKQAEGRMDGGDGGE